MTASLAVYVHWPYCLKKCPYCDFNSHVADMVDHDAWRAAYKKEIDYYKNLLGDRRVTSIFFGGGTPSLMHPQTIETVIKTLDLAWGLDQNCEITLEANPTSIESQKFSAFEQAGINRVSVGIQSFRDQDLQFLGREHSAKEALAALDIAANTFDRYSFDLIYALPNQSMDEWRAQLTKALEYAGDHLSLYQLTVESGTQFKIMHDRGELTELDGDSAADLYLMTQDMMATAGLPAYEISNYAREGQESRHNLTYWRYQDYVGIGPGAHGRLTLPNGDKIATRTHKAPDKYLSAVEEHEHGAKPFDILDPQTQKEEAMMMGLRLREGIDLGLVTSSRSPLTSPCSPLTSSRRRPGSHTNKDQILKQIQDDTLKPLINQDFLEITDNNRLRVPARHWPILDSILARILMG